MPIPVMFLPGLDGEAFTANRISEHLRASRLAVFTYPAGRELDWPSLCALVVARMEREGATLLAGESFGGAVAQETALRHAAAVKSMLLLSTFNHEVEPLASAVGRASTRLLPAALMKPMARALVDWKLAGSLKGDDRRKFLDRFAELDMNDVAARLKLLAGFDSRGRLASLKLPVEIVFGTRDAIGAAPAQLQAWQSLPDCKLHPIAGFGHLVSAEAAPQVAALIDAWAQRIAGGQAGDNRGN